MYYWATISAPVGTQLGCYPVSGSWYNCLQLWEPPHRVLPLCWKIALPLRCPWEISCHQCWLFHLHFSEELSLVCGHGADYNCPGITMGGEGSHRKASSQGLRGGGWGQSWVFEFLIIPIGSGKPPPRSTLQRQLGANVT